MVIHVQKRADLEDGAEPAGRLRDAAAADIEREVRREEPVVQTELVGLRPCGEFLDIHALVAFVRESVHEKTVAAGRGERVEDDDLPLRKLFEQEVPRRAGGVVNAGNP